MCCTLPTCSHVKHLFFSFFSLLLVCLFSFSCLSAALLPGISHSEDSLNALHDIWPDEYTHAPDGYMLAASRPQHLMQVLKPRLHGSYAAQQHMITINVWQCILYIAQLGLCIAPIKQCMWHLCERSAKSPARQVAQQVAVLHTVCNYADRLHEMRCSLAVANSQLLPHTILVDVLLQQREVITQRPLTLLADVVHIHGGVDSHDRCKLGCLAVLQRQLAHQTHIPAVAQLNPNPAERKCLHDTTKQSASMTCMLHHESTWQCCGKLGMLSVLDTLL